MACVGVLRLKIIADGRVVGGGLHQLDVFLDLRGQAVAIAGEHALHVGLVARDDDLAVQGAGQDDDGHQQNRDGQHHSDELPVGHGSGQNCLFHRRLSVTFEISCSMPRSANSLRMVSKARVTPSGAVSMRKLISVRLGLK